MLICVRICIGLAAIVASLGAQILQPLPARPTRANPPGADEIRISAKIQEAQGQKHKLRGDAVIETAEMLLKADEIDYDQESGNAEARGSVQFFHYDRGETLVADRVEYNVEEHTGKFYKIRGQSPAKIEARPGVLTTANPFYFEGDWAERIRDRYIVHQGTMTNCRIPNPWWTFRGPVFDVIPGERAIARKSVFRLKGVPLFYTPYFYKSLKRAPRKSGLLTPNIGNSSRRGFMLGGGYYWAINRSYDAAYRAQWFQTRGAAHHVDFRGKPNAHSDFNMILYGVNDKGRPDDPKIKEGGYLLNVDGRSDLKHGWIARADINHLSSFIFRQAFTESFYEAISFQVSSAAYLQKHWSTFGVNTVYANSEAFVGLKADPTEKRPYIQDTITIRKLPSVELTSRERELTTKVLPVWVSFDSSLSFLRRDQDAFQTRRFVERLDIYPRITTALHWKDFHLTPSFAVRETHYGSTFDAAGRVTGAGRLRNVQEFSAELILPPLARVYEVSNDWFGPKLKHVIEPRARYRYVTGASDFSRLIRFDETEIMSDTNEIELAVANRFYTKRRDGSVNELISWELAQQRYYDPSFGGAIVSGERNIVLSSAMLTGFSFLDRPRHYSPLVSTLRLYPVSVLGLEWRSDYDPLEKRIVNSTFQASGRRGNYSIFAGHNQLRVPWAKANQFLGMAGYGQENRRGWSGAFMAAYDYRVGVMQFATTQVTYNTDCCGFSLQYRRFNIGTRDEHQFRAALAIANIGSFGTLKRQERIF
ncbi:MAG TPA: LPS assembly protein LptD [Bryobacteraceae bacterium]|nr:LPS assembly protein LptD [Bryobacteraceae bacterium]